MFACTTKMLERTERWQGNRLVAFRGVTDKGDGPVEVKGEARGNNFVITSPQGTITAPASVHPANPWSSNFLHSNTMMRPDTGKLEQVRIGSGQETAVKLDSANVPAVKYEVDGSSKYTVGSTTVACRSNSSSTTTPAKSPSRWPNASAAMPKSRSWSRDNRSFPLSGTLPSHR